MPNFIVNAFNYLVHAGKRYDAGESVTLTEEEAVPIPPGVLTKQSETSKEESADVKADTRASKAADDNLNNPGAAGTSSAK